MTEISELHLQIDPDDTNSVALALKAIAENLEARLVRVERQVAALSYARNLMLLLEESGELRAISRVLTKREISEIVHDFAKASLDESASQPVDEDLTRVLMRVAQDGRIRLAASNGLLLEEPVQGSLLQDRNAGRLGEKPPT
jgi:hypothetical protein